MTLLIFNGKTSMEQVVKLFCHTLNQFEGQILVVFHKVPGTMNKGKCWRYEWPFILLLNFFAIGILSRLAPETSKWDGWQVLQPEVFPFHPITAWNEQTVLVSRKRPIFLWLEFVFEREKMLGEMFFWKWWTLIDDFDNWWWFWWLVILNNW